jgi:[acyl-carrier-protein] S-malonyltransferase
MTIAILCSGQGRQHTDMFSLTGKAPEAEPLFKRAMKLLGGLDPREVVRTATSKELHGNRVGQILCTLQALAAYAVLKEAISDRIVIAGYSVGEVAGWGVGELILAKDTLDLAATRAEVMDAVSPSHDGLLFVRGLRRSIIDELCVRHDADIAIVNPGEAFVLGGDRTALTALGEEARKRNAGRVVDVPVEVASHTKRLAKASSAFREQLSRVSVKRSLPVGRRLLSGIDGSSVFDVEEGLDKLAAQISQTVKWADCLESCIESGATHFLELGPGRALSDMVTVAYNGVPTRSLDDFRTVEGAREWLLGHQTS